MLGGEPSAKPIIWETRPFAASSAETIAKARTLLGQDAADRVLLIFDHQPPDIVSDLSDSRSDVIICADEAPGTDLGDCLDGRFEYGFLLNLPRPSSSIEAAVWLSSELDSDIAPFALREIFRVLKDGGQLVVAAAGETPGLDLRRALSSARIAVHQDEGPSAPVHFCALRKNGTQGEFPPSSAPSHAASQTHKSAPDPRLAPLEKENARQITRVRDQFIEWDKVVGEARTVVDDAVQRGFGGDGWIWISNRFADGYPAKFFMSG
jgi:hypothetical protein